MQYADLEANTLAGAEELGFEIGTKEDGQKMIKKLIDKLKEMNTFLSELVTSWDTEAGAEVEEPEEGAEGEEETEPEEAGDETAVVVEGEDELGIAGEETENEDTGGAVGEEIEADGEDPPLEDELPEELTEDEEALSNRRRMRQRRRRM